MHYCSNFIEANLLLTAVTFLGVTVTAVNFFVNAEGYAYIYICIAPSSDKNYL